MSDPVFKIVPPETWQAIQNAGRLDQRGDDARDGYIHLSAADQVAGTLAKHFAAYDQLVLLTVDAHALGEALHWERSRGGALFPHLYGLLPLNAVQEATPLTRGPDGTFTLPALFKEHA